MDYKEKCKDALDRVRELALAGKISADDILNRFPELRESEDERIRKNILALVKKRAVNHERCQMEDYLENLKEQKPISSCDIVPYIDDKIAALQDMWREEKVAFDWDDMREMIEDVARHFYQKEQKPADKPSMLQLLREHLANTPKEQLDAEFEALEHLTIDKPAECIEDSLKFEEGFKAGRESGLRDGQKYVLDNLDSYGLCESAEWSEEDENALNYLHELIGFGYSEKFMDAQTAADMRDWVNKSLRPQPKQEWSEEDSKYASYVCAAIDCYYMLREERNNHNGQEELDAAKNWLKNRLKSLRPQPHWKPSEEQMAALKNSAYGAYQVGDGPALRELYEQLKKL